MNDLADNDFCQMVEEEGDNSFSFHLFKHYAQIQHRKSSLKEIFTHTWPLKAPNGAIH